MTASTNGLNFLAPHNLDAEEAILGGIMLDPGAMDRVADLLSPEVFYVGAHQEIYRAASKLYQEGQPTDFMNVTSWLYDHKRLDKVGGQSKIAQLIERTVSAVNIDRYAELVMDCYQRRLLMSDGWELAQLAADKFNPLDTVTDIARRKLEKIIHLKSSDREKSYLRYSKLMAEVEAIQLKIEDPGFRKWELQCLASKYKLSILTLEHLWYCSLIQQQDTPCQAWAEVEAESNTVPEWAIHGIMPIPGVVIVHAPANTGKTRLFNEWALKIATGIAWEEFPVTSPSRPILFIQTDELKDEMISSLRQSGFNGNENIEFKLNWSIDNIPSLYKELPRFKDGICLIDSLSSVNTGLISENDIEYARPILVLQKLSQEFNITFVILHHSSREGGMRGSTALEAAASMILKLTYDPDDSSIDSPKRILEIQKSRTRRRTKYALEFFEELDGDLPRLRWACHGEYKKEDVDLPIKERIVRFLSARRNVRHECVELHHHIGGSLGAVRRAAGRLAKDGIISSCEGANRRMQYFLSWFGDPGGGRSDPDHSPDHSQNLGGEGFSGMSDPGSLNGGGDKNEIPPETSDPGSLKRSPTGETTSPQVLQPPESSDPPSDPDLITDQMNDCILKIDGFLDAGITEYTEPLIEAYGRELSWTTDQIKEVRSRVNAIADENTSGENDSGENDSGENDSGENDSGENDSGENDSGEKSTIERLFSLGAGSLVRSDRTGKRGRIVRIKRRPKEIWITWESTGLIDQYSEAELEIMLIQPWILKAGLPVEYQQHWGVLVASAKDGKWFVRWDKSSERKSKGPTSPIDPIDLVELKHET